MHEEQHGGADGQSLCLGGEEALRRAHDMSFCRTYDVKTTLTAVAAMGLPNMRTTDLLWFQLHGGLTGSEESRQRRNILIMRNKNRNKSFRKKIFNRFFLYSSCSLLQWE